MNKNLCLCAGLTGLIVILALSGTQKAAATCTPDMLKDWPDIPCGPIGLSKDELRTYWQGYYEFKGKDWMEEKKSEMEQAIFSGNLEQWRSNISNYDVWVYYKITNNVPEVSPLKQFKSGIMAENIQCKEGLELIFKAGSGSPACVKPETKIKLIERGWTKDGKEQFVKISLGEFKNVHSVGSPINDFIINLEGYFPTYNSPDIKLEDEAGNIVWTNYDDIGHVYTSRVSSVEFCKEYRFYDIGDPLIINKTGTYKFIFSFEGFSIEKEIKIRENVSDVSIDSPAFHCP